LGKRERLLEILRRKAVQRGSFRLASGAMSDYYIDCRLVTLDPEGASLLGEIFSDLAISLGATAVAGLTLGADPLVVAAGLTAYQRKKPLKMALVRKEPKSHGQKRRIEGPSFDQKDRVLILEDVATTGASALTAVDAVKDEFNCEIVAVVAVVNRNEGAKQAIEGRGIKFIALFEKEELL